jgi:hypothetical protein
MSIQASAVSLLAFVLVSLSFSASLQPKATPRSLSVSEQALVDGSKRAVIETGLSAEYFDMHFKLETVVDKPSDHRVVWRFSVNGYETRLTDSIGSYSEGTKRIYTHSIASALGHTSEIKRTISYARALRIMKLCIGNFENPAVEYGPVDGYAQLLLVAHARRRTKQIDTAREQRGNSVAAAPATDVIKSEEENGERRPIKLGNVNLQTGKCIRGTGLVAP